ncbi:ribonuclease Y [Roseisolibacter sp. H3M3-2]|uniref:ribonuclease Y n=1 Tax=Roseisolibacter sp. H3M3-2 TaxID=3031323 RepID=UPI0023DABD4C|nr:ribonuclease Y [Roseisolibacter sp. H3M3-2]MDF1505664.1 ribonuclease Y [Roseisolibacter sp. H3M3-2]
MGEQAILALLGVLVAVGAAVGAFAYGRGAGRSAGLVEGRAEEVERQRAAKATAEETAKRIVGDAEREAEAARKSAVVTGKEELLRLREAQEGEVRGRREEVEREERRLQEREAQLDRKSETIDQRDRELARRASELGRREKVVADQEGAIESLRADATRRLEELAGLSAADARAELMRRMEEQAQADAANRIREIRETARRNAEREAKKIVALAVQRIAAEHTAETTVSSVALPNDEMKGRIIGREGRNIRAFELATGVDVIIDDTPDTVVVSCFEPVRREVARQALEKLVSDGRIHPGRIEEVVNKARQEVDKQIVETGEQAAYEVGVAGLHPELVKLVGRMRWRTSYGQNILQHSKEVAWLAGIMAAELGLDVAMAKRGALLHDVGKVLTHEHEGTHVQLGVEMATRYGEHPLVVNAIAAHHDDVPHESEVSVLVQAADAISGSRPGARREAFETYVKRLEGLERIASSYRGVEKVFAIQAGREVRIVVTPEDVDDVRMTALSEEIARRIEAELQYPGQIKVVVIRETRAVDFAR